MVDKIEEINVGDVVEITKGQSQEYLPSSDILTLLKKPNQYTNYSNYIKD